MSGAKSSEDNIRGGNFMVGSNCPGRQLSRGKCPDTINHNAGFFNYTCLICLHSQFKFLSKLILHSAKGGIIMIIRALHFS